MINAPAQGEDSHSSLHFVLFYHVAILRRNRSLEYRILMSTSPCTPTKINVHVPCFFSDSHSPNPRTTQGRGQSITCIYEYRPSPHHHHKQMALPFTSRRSPVLCRHGCVACSQPLAAEIGLQVLRRGGNAADAAVAVAAALNVTEPCSTGIGGDCFCLFYDASSKEVQGINGR